MDDPEKRPVPAAARAFALFILVTSAAGAAFVLGAALFNGAELRWKRLVTSGFTAYAAFRAWRGHADGVNSLFWLFAILTALVAVGLTAGLTSGEEVPRALPFLLAYVALGLVVFTWARFGSGGRGYAPGSYQDWLTNRDARDAAGAWFAERDALFAADDESPPDCDALVEELLDDDLRDMARARLAHQGERAAPAVCAALENDPFRGDQEAFEALIELLPSPPPRAAATGLAANLERLDGYRRSWALESLASIGRDEEKEVILASLAVEHDAEPVACGLLAAVEGERCDRGLWAAVAPELRRIALDGGDDLHATAATALAVREPAFARELADGLERAPGSRIRVAAAVERAHGSIGPEPFRPLWRDALERRNFRRAEELTRVAGLTEAEALSLIDRCSSDLDVDRAEGAYVEALRALVERGAPSAEQAIVRAAAVGRGLLTDTAAELLCELHGVPPGGFVREDRRGTPEARAVSALRWLVSYTSNGGLVHAFRCLDETDARELPRALEAVAPVEVRDIVMRATELVADGPLPADSDARDDLITERYAGIEKELDELDVAFYSASPALEWALARHCVRHKVLLADAFFED
ncbi:MAG: DUF4375 domain-containing protein [Planctomycetota bacterium]